MGCPAAASCLRHAFCYRTGCGLRRTVFVVCLAALLSVDGTLGTAVTRLSSSQLKKHSRGITEEASPAVKHRTLDIVLAHFHSERIGPMLDTWLDFLEQKKVKSLQPSVFVYCQNSGGINDTVFKPLFQYGGGVVHLDNVGRESHAYLQHLLRHWNDLADHTLFSQDIPESKLKPRFLKLFEPQTGFLPLSLVGHVACSDDFLPQASMQQLYSMFTATLCPPEGFTGAFEGQFIASRKRIRKHDWWTYHHLIEIVGAAEGHWIHDTHQNKYYKDRSNPLFGHALERAWSLAFNCYDSWRMVNCVACDNEKQMQDCGGDACQCFDH